MHHKNVLVAQRKCHALSKRELGALISRSPDTVAHYEDGSVAPTLKIALALSFLFGISVSDLFPELALAVAYAMVPAISELSASLDGKTGPVVDRKRSFIQTLTQRLERVMPQV